MRVDRSVSGVGGAPSAWARPGREGRAAPRRRLAGRTRLQSYLPFFLEAQRDLVRQWGLGIPGVGERAQNQGLGSWQEGAAAGPGLRLAECPAHPSGLSPAGPDAASLLWSQHTTPW